MSIAPRTSRSRGWGAWVGGVAIIGVCMQLGLGALHTLAAAWTFLFLATSVAIAITAWFWPERRAVWRGYRLSLGVAIGLLLATTGLAALVQYVLFGLDHLTM